MLSLLITTNVKGATLTDAEYARLKLVFSDLRIATMSMTIIYAKHYPPPYLSARAVLPPT